MTEKLKNTIQEEIMKLPKEGQDAINSLDWVKITEEISRKYLLTNEDEINNLQVETLLVLVGITDPEFYPINVENQVNTTKDEAQKISAEVSEKIFIPVYNKFIDNVKKNQKDKSANWEQNLNFVLSGGDYSAFVAPARISSPPDKEGNEGRLNAPHPDPLLVEERGEEGNMRINTDNSRKEVKDLRDQFKI